MQSDKRPFRVLFLCTGNSARSIIGEYLIRQIGQGRFESFSAGASPAGRVNPFAIRALKELYDIDASDARSKSLEEYSGEEFDFVITLCDNARDVCPVWPGRAILAHWGIDDPAAVEGSDEEKMEAFRKAALRLQRRIELFCSLPLDKLDRLRLEKMTRDIGERD